MICSNIKLIAQRESIELAIREIHEQNQMDSEMDLYRKLEILAGREVDCFASLAMTRKE